MVSEIAKSKLVRSTVSTQLTFWLSVCVRTALITSASVTLASIVWPRGSVLENALFFVASSFVGGAATILILFAKGKVEELRYLSVQADQHDGLFEVGKYVANASLYPRGYQDLNAIDFVSRWSVWSVVGACGVAFLIFLGK